MSFKIRTSAWLAGTALAGLLGGAIDAQAGGFALREQSVVGQGASFAGVAAGGAASSMFWNPATMTQQMGINFETGVSLIVPNASHSFTASALSALPGFTGTTENSGDWAVVPSSYTTYQFNDRFWVGMSINAPYGLGVAFPKTWAGAGYAQDTDLKTYSFGPSAAYKINDWISVGVGLQAQYMKASYDSLGTAFPFPTTHFNLSGSGWAFGWTAGVTFTPLAGTEIGLGYRSALNQKLDGNISGGIGAATVGTVELTVNLPEVASLGIRQRIGDSFTLLGTVEWTNWSRIGTAAVTTPSGAAAVAANGITPITLPFQYDDGWFYSIGGEYVLQPNLTLRAGVGFEKSPVTDLVRNPRLPDNDRYWFSAGASYKPAQFPGLVFDLAYTYIDVVDTHIDISAASGNPWLNAFGTYIGDVNANVHIFSLGARYKFPEPQKALITKG